MTINKLDTDKFVEQNFSITKEVKDDFELIQYMQNVFVATGEREGWQHGPVGGAPCQLDLRFIYMMTGLIKPKKVIEIGTWSGLSAHVIALAMSRYTDEFRIDTCDVVNVYQAPIDFIDLNKNIRFYNCHSNQMYEKLMDNKYDFVFADASLNSFDVSSIKKLMLDEKKMFFMSHDVYPNKYEKGNAAIDIIRKSCFNDQAHCFIPNKLDVGYTIENIMLNSCTGFLMSSELYDGFR